MASVRIKENFGSITNQNPNQLFDVWQNFGRIDPWDFVPGTIDMDENLLNRPVNPDLMDFDLVKAWLNVCEKGHQHARKASAAHLNTYCDTPSPHDVKIRLVDVQDQCIVLSSSATRYFTLSYTWGGVDQLGLTLENKAQLSSLQSLRDLHLPKTIRDAMILVAQLGERYLWVDMLCIIQNSVEDKTYTISHMAEIYTKAVLVLVAVEGSDANAGLSRVNGKFSGNHSLYERLPVDDNAAHPRYIQDLNGIWATRGWTYQETVLPVRLLLVLEHKVTFVCGQIQFTEGGVPQAPVIHPRLESIFTKLSRRNSLEVYEHAVHIYSRLELTYEDDVLDAFSGILSQLRPYMHSRFVFGIPETELVSALSWRCHTVGMPGSYHEPAIRRIDLKTNRPWGPSWSWMGWKIGVHYDYALWPHQEMIMFIVAADSEMEKPMPPWTGQDVSCEYYRCPVGDGEREIWNWGLDQYDPRYYWHDSEPHVRIVNPTFPESRRPFGIFIPPGEHCINLSGLTVCLSPIPLSQMKRRLMGGCPRPTLKYLPVLDADDFQAGELDLSLLPSNLPVSSPDDASDIVFRLVPTAPEGEHFPDGELTLLQLSRFVGIAGTQEVPHVFKRQTKEPRNKEHQDALNNIKLPIPLEAAESQISTALAKDDGEEINKQEDDIYHDKNGFRYTYNPVRFETSKYYPFANVLVLVWDGGIAYRVGIGQVHIDAWMAAEPVWKRTTIA